MFYHALLLWPLLVFTTFASLEQSESLSITNIQPLTVVTNPKSCSAAMAGHFASAMSLYIHDLLNLLHSNQAMLTSIKDSFWKWQRFPGVPIPKSNGIKYIQLNIASISSIWLLLWLGRQTYGLPCNGNKDSPESYHWHMRQGNTNLLSPGSRRHLWCWEHWDRAGKPQVKRRCGKGKKKPINWDWKKSFGPNWTEVMETVFSGSNAEVLLKMQKIT